MITSEDLGKTVYLSNSTTACQEWIIAGINRNNITAIDLIAKYEIGYAWKFQYTYKKSPASPATTESTRSWIYNDSFNYLNSTFLNGFAVEVQNAMKELLLIQAEKYTSSGYPSTVKGKVFIPSLVELGNTHNAEYYMKQDSNGLANSTVFPIFSDNESRKVCNAYGTEKAYVVRSYDTSAAASQNANYMIATYGATVEYTSESGTRPFIKIAYV